jgi:glycerate kinase
VEDFIEWNTLKASQTTVRLLDAATARCVMVSHVDDPYTGVQGDANVYKASKGMVRRQAQVEAEES